MIENLQAVNTYVLIIRDEVEEEINGLVLPDQAKIKPARGKIISVGEGVMDKNIQVGRKALFNKNVGFLLELQEDEITVLESNQIIAVI